MNLEQQRLGDYVLAERLAEDTTGTLYRAVHATQKTEVAVKVLHAKYRNDPALVARFKQAAKNLGGVNHPGIAQVLDHGESASGLFLVMEKLVGETLAARLKRERRLSLKETQEIVGAVASALAAAHRQRIVHRKLDADSVFLVGGDAGTAVKILGLGLAKLLGHKESGSGKDVDQRADILALGSLSYEMLSGQAPVPVSVQPSERQPGGPRPKAARLSTLDVTVPSAVEAAIMKALEGKKKRRFSSMAEFARAFGAPFALRCTSAQAGRRHRTLHGGGAPAHTHAGAARAAPSGTVDHPNGRDGPPAGARSQSEAATDRNGGRRRGRSGAGHPLVRVSLGRAT
jgi:eukaryotic-like serine/threonine-protein kinase